MFSVKYRISYQHCIAKYRGLRIAICQFPNSLQDNPDNLPYSTEYIRIHAMICELEHNRNYRLSRTSLINFPNDVLCAQKGPALFHHSLVFSLDHHHHHQSSTFACIVLIRGTSCNNKAFYGGFFPLSLKTSLSWISRVTLHVFVKFNFSILTIALSKFFYIIISHNQNLQY